MAESDPGRDFSLLSLLKANYPSVPITTILKFMNKFDNDEEKCKQALEVEADRRNNTPEANSESSSSVPAVNCANNNNIGSPGEGRSITARIRELQVSHEGSPQPKPGPADRHISTIERSIGSVSRLPEQKRPIVNQSVSWTVQADRSTPSGAQAYMSRASDTSMATPQTAPPDFSPFFNRSATDIPNIDCKTYVPSGGINRPHQIPISSSSASSSPGEQRRPVKVINIPPGSLSGGSVSPAATPPNSRHIRMHFGDTGGVCTVSTPPSNMQRYGSTPNVSSQQFRSELRTDASAPQPQQVHSSSIFVNTNSHGNHLSADRKHNSNSGSDSSGNGRRTPNPPLTLNTVVSDVQSSSIMSNPFSSGIPLSTPVQASSPGTAHSRPVFVEIKKDTMPSGYDTTYSTSNFYPGNNVRPPPSNSTFLSHPGLAYNSPGGVLSYNPQFNPDFSNPSGFPIGQQEQLYPQQQKHPGFNSSPTNLYHPSSGSGYNPNYPHFNNPSNIMGYTVCSAGPMSIPGHMPGNHMSQYTHYNLPKSPNVGVSQPSLSSRSNSQDSEHSACGTDYDSRHTPYNNMGSRVSSHSSLSSDSSASRIDRVDQRERPRSGSIQDEADYIRALLQHQRSRMMKLKEDMNQYRVILDNLRSEVGIMERNMIETSHVNKSFPSAEDISRLCESNRKLQTDIQVFMNEIDMYKSGQTPFNKINPLDQQNFFENMPTGQQDPIYSRTPDGNRSPSPRRSPPPRPPPPIPVRQPSTDNNNMNVVPPHPPTQPIVNSGDSEEGESWSCSACTFSNHPALKKCEMCEMPRVMPPHPASTAGPPPALPPHQPLNLPPRLPPGIVGNIRPRSGSPHSPLGHRQHQHHHHRAGT